MVLRVRAERVRARQLGKSPFPHDHYVLTTQGWVMADN